MKPILHLLTVFVLLSACDEPQAKFHAGDRVRIKLSPEVKDGVIVARLSPLVDDHYYVRFIDANGKKDERNFYAEDLEKTP